MKQTVNESDFRDAFRAHDRMENFSYEGLGVLFEFLESLEQDTGEEMELDVIALCCDFYESSAEDIADNYNIDISTCVDAEEISETVEAYLNEQTLVVGAVGDGFIYQAF